MMTASKTVITDMDSIDDIVEILSNEYAMLDENDVEEYELSNYKQWEEKYNEVQDNIHISRIW